MQVGNLLGHLLKKFGDNVLPYMEPLLPKFAPALDRTRASVDDRRIAICIVDDLLEHSPAARAKYGPQMLPMLLEACAEVDHAETVQCATYGLGVMAVKAPEMFRYVFLIW